ncbi:MAG: ABC transporter permease, partial [Acidobacteriia bacterium]|nr:ABC transporter permease [Terriglobia bacterium]
MAVLTDGLWRRRFHADPGLIGRAIVLEGRAHTVIGVLPASFRFPDRNVFGGGQAVPPRTEVFRPKVFSKDELAELVGRFNYGAIARLEPGASLQRAAAELEAVQAQMETLAGERLNEKALVTPLLDNIVGGARRGLLVLMGAIAVLLLIVCVNLANLVLARGERRSREAAVRAALGAGRARLMRHPLLETGLICLAGGLLAIGVADIGMRLLIHYAPPNLPRIDEVRLDGRVIAFAGALVAVTALLTGLLPAWRAAGA